MVWGSTVLVCAESSTQVFNVPSVTSVMDMHILIRHEPEKAWMATLICSDGSGRLTSKNIISCKDFVVFKNDEVAAVESDSRDVIRLDYVGFHDK